VVWTDPAAALGVGAGLSFAAVAGLLAGAPTVEAVAGRAPKILRRPLVLLLVSIVATAATGPLVAAVFGRVPLAGIWVNVLAIPAFAVILPMALAGASLGCFSEPLGASVVSVAAWALDALHPVVEAIAPESTLVLWSPHPATTSLIYAAWVWLLLRGGRA